MDLKAAKRFFYCFLVKKKMKSSTSDFLFLRFFLFSQVKLFLKTFFFFCLGFWQNIQITCSLLIFAAKKFRYKILRQI